MKLDILKLKRHPLFQHPACYKDHHSMHVDGNRKLHRFNKFPWSVKFTHLLYYDCNSFIMILVSTGCITVYLYRGIWTSYYEDFFICKMMT